MKVGAKGAGGRCIIPDILPYPKGRLADDRDLVSGINTEEVRTMRKEVQEKEARLFQELKVALEKSQALALSCLA